jgi:hypothetical protein
MLCNSVECTDVSLIRNEHRNQIGRSIYSINLLEFQSAVGRMIFYRLV